jgi:O-antigen ligase
MEKTQARLLAIGSIAITIFMISNAVTDPVNAPKFFLLGTLGFACAALLGAQNFKKIWSYQKVISGAVILFLLSAVFTLLMSSAPLSQSLYGAYGRNNGFIAYASLAFILITAANLKNEKSYSWIAYALLISGMVNVFYCAWVVLFGDFMAWNNTYNNLLGTFGNPNFVGSFLSIFATSSMAYLFSSQISIKLRALLGLVSLIAIAEMLKTNVMQGKVVLGLGTLLVIGAFIRSKSANALITWVYFSIVGIIGITAILGILQKGPLAKYIYQYTVSLRGQYWRAGLNTGKENLLHGVGFDSLGDWYRRTRSAQALITPGTEVTTNSAHNVVIDMFAFGGIPLLISYLAIIVITVIAIISRFVSEKRYDPIFVALSVGWIGYQAQSFISINQLGLAIWGWVLSGAIIGYAKLGKAKTQNIESEKSNQRVNVRAASPISPQLIAGLGLVIGALIAVPPLSADINFRNAQVIRNAEVFEQALVPTYMHPQSTSMYLNSILLFEQSGLNANALEITKKALSFNKDSFETWRALYFLKNASEVDKVEALRNMKRLDPLNPNTTSNK